MNELEAYLSNYFELKDPEETRIIGELFRPVSLEKGHLLAKTGTPCTEMAFVRSGLLRVYAYTADKEVTQWISTPGYFVTDLTSFLFHTPARRNIEALTAVELFSISRSDYASIHRLVPRWAELEKLFLAKCFTLMEDRIFSHLSMTAEERYQSFFEQNRELFQQVPLQYIASMLGMTPETFSRIRKKLLR